MRAAGHLVRGDLPQELLATLHFDGQALAQMLSRGIFRWRWEGAPPLSHHPTVASRAGGGGCSLQLEEGWRWGLLSHLQLKRAHIANEEGGVKA